MPADDSSKGGVKKTKKLKLKRSAGAASSAKLSVSQLVEKANACLEEIPPRIDQAIGFFEHALRIDPNSVAALDSFGALLCDEGDHPRATELLERSISLEPNRGHDKYLHLAQMSAGADALKHYERGVEVLSKQIAEIGSDKGGTPEHTKLAEVQASIAELFMTELCDEADAEDRCEAAIKRGLDADANCLEILVAKLALRKVQGQIDEAKELGRACLQKVKEATTSTDPDAILPSDEVSIALSRALIDLGLSDEGRHVLLRLLEQDEDDVQVWYLLACSHLVESDPAPVKECAEQGLAVCEQLGENAGDWPQMFAEVLKQAAQLKCNKADEDGAEAGDEED